MSMHLLRVKVKDRLTRNNKRSMAQADPDFLQELWRRILVLVPTTVESGQGLWTADGLNERLRFYKYDKDEQFKPHFDGCYASAKNRMSFVTVIVYLSEDFKGGETTFFMPGKNRQRRNRDWRDNYDQVKVTPQTGNALIFMHGRSPLSPLHEGTLVREGVKYVLRTDVMYMYSREPADGKEGKQGAGEVEKEEEPAVAPAKRSD